MRIISFRVISTSSEDVNYLSAELNEHGPSVRGWRSAKNATFPQNVVIQLDDFHVLKRIQILPHEFLIPQKIEIWYCEDDNVRNEETDWKLLGFISFSDNRKTNYKSRELKSVDVPFCSTKFIKLSIVDNHKNELNRNDQVSIIAVNILGEPNKEDDNYDFFPLNDSHHQSPYDDLSFTMYCDKEIADLIQALNIKKHQAVYVERFEYARKIKEAITHLKKIGETLGKLCLEKRIAIENENFERAQRKKQQSESIRKQCYQELLIDQLLEKNGLILDNDDYNDEFNQKCINKNGNLSSNLNSKSNSISKNSMYEPVVHLNSGSRGISNNLEDTLSPCKLEISDSSSIEFFGLSKSLNSSVRQRNNSVDNETKSLYNYIDDRFFSTMKHSQTEEYLRSYQNDTIVSDLKQKSKLNDRDRKQASLAILVFGDELVEKVYSKYYADKEDGLQMLKKKLEDFKILDSQKVDDQKLKRTQNANRMTRATVFLLQRTIRDKVFSVFSLSNEIVRMLLVDFIANCKVSDAETTRTVDKLLPELLTKTGDASTRVNHMAMHTVLSLTESDPLKKLHTIPVLLSRPINSTVHPRLALSRMEMVEQLILNQGVLKEKQSGLSCRTLLDFGLSGLHHPSEPVRKVAERILVQVYKKNPQIVRKQLPPDDDITRRNLQYRNLFHQFDSIEVEKKFQFIQKKVLIKNGDGGKNTESCSISAHSDL